MQACRIDDRGRVDRSRPVHFTFNRKAYVGYDGDTLASALLANGVRIVGRSFKFHRPRGIVSAGAEESGGVVSADFGQGMLPVTRATQIPLVEGMSAEAQNCFPSLEFDLLRILDYTRPLWLAGFYNKTFKWPNWHAYEWLIRRAAGLGHLPEMVNPARYSQMNAHCEILIVGSGPSGLAAALQAGRAGDDVLLVEQDSELGGSLLFDDSDIDGQSGSDWLAASRDELQGLVNVRVMTLATAAGYYDSNVVTIHDRSSAYRRNRPVELFWKVRAGRVVLATGAIEQPLMFGNNDLPGVMLAGAMHQYTSRYGVQCGRRIVGVVNNDLAWHSIMAQADAGVDVPAIIDTRANVEEALIGRAESCGIDVYTSGMPVSAGGSRTVTGMRFHDATGRSGSISCDAIAMSGGMSPTVHLYSQAGGQLRYDEQLACFVPHSCLQRVDVVGSANGEFVRNGTYTVGTRTPSPAKTSTQWVDFIHDVTVADIELACLENLRSVEHIKRYTAAGMAVDQGKTSNLNALTLLGELTGRAPGDVGTTTFRPNFMPVTMGSIGGLRRGKFYIPAKRLPVDEWHAARGAEFEDYGGWDRPAYYGNDREASICQEVKVVRETVGLFDASPLGKIEVQGPDAAEFLNRVYLNMVPTLQTGKVRYGLMLDENGVIMDDGVFARLAGEHFLINTTSGHADRVAGWLEEWHQCEWPDMELVMSNVTSQWGVITLAGPNARAVLSDLPGMMDLSSDKFSHMSVAAGELDDGTPYRIQRVSFTGEQSYELSIPANAATAQFERIWRVGESHGIGTFGVEALMILRLEKGFLHVGVDTDGSTNPMDAGFGRIVENKKTDYIGARSLRRPEDLRGDRRQLIGFETDDRLAPVLAGAHFVSGSGASLRSEGFVTSACLSPTMHKTIGLGLLEGGSERLGDAIEIYDDGRRVSGRIVNPCFFDPAGERMRG